METDSLDIHADLPSPPCIRSSKMLLAEHPLICRIATSALGGYACAVLLISLDTVGWINLGQGYVVALFMGITLVGGLLAMFGASYFVVVKRRKLNDIGMFLTVTWVIPYMGIACTLGVPLLLRAIRHVASGRRMGVIRRSGRRGSCFRPQLHPQRPAHPKHRLEIQRSGAIQLPAHGVAAHPAGAGDPAPAVQFRHQQQGARDARFVAVLQA
ncbi:MULTISPECIES: hypothetical protein [unclassified Stenotrophomonas]|uniref:hypothetical protein n=1 Tax=unclassified Stenotrophomonas TaxID=196198 RepID=UPI0012FEFEB1|nr:MULTISPECIES: hypothetical protein [unclassified Stenotrophomonas]